MQLIPLSIFSVLDYELNRLYVLFSNYSQLSNIDGQSVETISKDEVLQFPQLMYNPLKERIVEVLQLNEIITFEELVVALQKFSVNYPKTGKIKRMCTSSIGMLPLFSYLSNSILVQL